MSFREANWSVRSLLSVAAFALVLGLALPASAQDYRGKVSGTVSDVNTAAIPGARIVLHNDETGVEVERQTDSDGHYQFDFVDPGNYTITVEASGFKKVEQKNVVVRQRGDITADLTLEVGGVADVVTVEAPPVEVEFTTSGSALTIENKVIDQLPIRGRNPYSVSTLDPTVSPGTGSTSNENRPYHHAYANDIDAGGGTQRANDVLLDGVPLTSSYKTSYTPSMDAVQEVTFQKNAVDAEYGYSSGGVIVLNMKAGTNEWHGTAIANGRSPRFNAFNDPTTIRRGGDERNFRGTNLKIYGGTVGGPIIKNKLFTFTSYEHWKDVSPLSFVLTLPTALERAGDFSQSRLSNGVIRNIFDPLTSTGSSGTRTQFTGNVIPTGRFDPTALKLLAELPLPNLPGSQDNYQGFRVNNTTYWNFSERVDWNYSEKWKTFFRYGHFKAHLLESNPDPGKLLPVNGSNRYGLSVAADSVYTINPKTILNVRANFHQLTDEYAAETALIGKDALASLFPNFYSSLYTFDQVYYPALDVGSGSFGSSTNTRIGRPGREFWQHPQGFGGSVRLNRYQGDHSLKFGGEYRVDKGKGARFEPLNFIFRQQLTANANSSPNLNTSGSPWATFLLGYIDNNSFASRVPIQEAIAKGYASYFQDDYRVTPRLTLNLGLRWEYEPGPVDAQNRISQRLDLTQPIPEFQTTPPNIPATVTNLLASKGERQLFNGAWIFATPGDRSAWHRDKLNLLPRIGGAFRIDDKSVVRFGYARYNEPASRIRDPLGDFVNQYAGYATTTTGAPTINNGIPQVRISNPFPSNLTPIQQPIGQSLGRYTNLGNAIGAAFNATNGIDQFDLQPQTNDRVSLSYQRSVWGHFILNFDYFYNRGNNIPYAVDLNMVDPAFSYEIPRSTFNQTVTNPFFNYLTPDKFPGSLRNQATITIGALLRPYPQYGAINQTNTSGRKEHLHSMTIEAQRPFAKGLSLLVAYAYQREQTQEFFDDFAQFARRFEWRDTDTPRHRLTSALSWDVPVGRGRWLWKEAPKAVDMVLGGWQYTTTTRVYSGRPLFFSQNLIVDGNPRISNPQKGPGALWFDITKFHVLPTSTLASDPVNLHRRDNPWTFPGLVGPTTWQTDMTLSKAFHITERFRLEARVESYNAFNRINWDNPTVDFTSGTFGRVTRKLVAYNGREMQYGLRLVF